ncbi:hypothetical protein [Bradyrhizobium sp. Bra64]|uniref:hypothetical protein n=1 Tax=Bradyrhizobium sp. Bra64 TaxID=2926009 RepID=UPI00211816EA|nr:hypothetical protein [Bradyrhizobium sp. Bra64]
MHVVKVTLVIGSNIALSSSMSSFDAANVERLSRLVNEMALHIWHLRAGALLLLQAPTDGFISR